MQCGKARSCKVLLFDMDGTLYPTDNGYGDHIRQQLFGFMERTLNIPNPREVWAPLFKKYNQTLRGLRAEGYIFDSNEYWAESRRGSSDFLVKASTHLIDMIESLPQEKYVFTNCNEKEAEEILNLLGISHLFKRVYGATYMGQFCKPEREVYDKVLCELAVDASEVVLFEDSFKNLVTAKELGMVTVLVDSDTAREEEVTELMKSSLDGVLTFDQFSREVLELQLPFLWEK